MNTPEPYGEQDPYRCENYKMGVFYNRKENPKLFVPKGNGGMGYTLNFSNKWSYVIVVLLIAFVVAVLILAITAKN